MKWNRIGDETECPICRHLGWCMVSSDHRYICCKRVRSPIALGEAGSIHPYRGVLNIHPQQTNYDPNYWRKTWAKSTTILPGYLASLWNVSLESIEVFNTTWHTSKRCYLFPMYNGTGEMVGLQERHLTGEKKATAGSKLGLFIPTFNFRQTKGLIITEGVSDAVVLYDDTRLPIIGRPSCSTGTTHIKDFLNSYTNIKNVVIVADNDDVGIQGAQSLRDTLKDTIKYLDVTILPPVAGSKDVREMKRNNPSYYRNFLELLKNVLYFSKGD